MACLDPLLSTFHRSLCMPRPTLPNLNRLAPPPPAQLTGGLPSTWHNRFAALQVLTLSNMPSLGGTLPPVWGMAGAFPSLDTLDLSNSSFTGPLPAWGQGGSLPKLEIMCVAALVTPAVVVLCRLLSSTVSSLGLCRSLAEPLGFCLPSTFG